MDSDGQTGKKRTGGMETGSSASVPGLDQGRRSNQLYTIWIPLGTDREERSRLSGGARGGSGGATDLSGGAGD